MTSTGSRFHAIPSAESQIAPFGSRPSRVDRATPRTASHPPKSPRTSADPRRSPTRPVPGRGPSPGRRLEVHTAASTFSPASVQPTATSASAPDTDRVDLLVAGRAQRIVVDRRPCSVGPDPDRRVEVASFRRRGPDHDQPSSRIVAARIRWSPGRGACSPGHWTRPSISRSRRRDRPGPHPTPRPPGPAPPRPRPPSPGRPFRATPWRHLRSGPSSILHRPTATPRHRCHRRSVRIPRRRDRDPCSRRHHPLIADASEGAPARVQRAVRRRPGGRVRLSPASSRPTATTSVHDGGVGDRLVPGSDDARCRRRST